MRAVKQTYFGDVQIDAGPVVLQGSLEVPAGAPGVVLFAHGSGSGRFSSRNRHVAAVLREGGLGTLLFDLLTEEEASNRANVFDIPLLASRLLAAARWLRQQPVMAGEEPARIGLFGASTGAAAALVAAAEEPEIAAVVSRGGRPDLAGPALAHVRAPTLLIVGGDDVGVVELNREAFDALTCPRQIVFISGATHLFEEPGSLDRVAELAQDWFGRYFRAEELPRRGGEPLGRRF